MLGSILQMDESLSPIACRRFMPLAQASTDLTRELSRDSRQADGNQSVLAASMPTHNGSGEKAPAIVEQWMRVESDLRQKQNVKPSPSLPANLSKFFRLSFMEPLRRNSDRRRASIKARPTLSFIKNKQDLLPDGLRTFVEFAKIHLGMRVAAERSKVDKSLRDFFEGEIEKFMENFKILRDYDIESMFLEQVLSNYLTRFVAKDFQATFYEVVVKDNKLKPFLPAVMSYKVDFLAKDYYRLTDKGRQWAFLKTFQVFEEMAKALVFEVKTRHYGKLEADVKREFEKYKEKYADFLVSKKKFTIFRQDLHDNHEMIKAARKFNTVIGKFDILAFQEQRHDEGILAGDPSSKTFVLNRHMRQVIAEFAKLE